MSDVRQVLAEAQAAEARGDKSQAISLLKRAAELYRDGQNHQRALKMLRHIRRLEGIEELEVLEGGNAPGPQGRRRRVIEERGPQAADPSLDAWCSFCCRPKAEAGPLVSGPTGSFICASCLGAAQGFLGGLPLPRARSPELLPHQQTAAERLSRGRLGLLLGPAGSGKSTVLAALAGATCLEVEALLTAVPEAPKVVLAVRADPPAPPLVFKGQPVWDTATLVAACGAVLPEAVLARVDAVAVLPAFDEPALTALAARLGVTEGAEALVALALKAAAPARELCALVARLGP
ncbi:MAG: ClpX C4-type zinc finger protein [Archangiaceae bacterium]|nr:ClpX C4-type zinc finger protein [Archangiaceae bacterium]